VERRGPAVCEVAANKGGKGDMIKAPDHLQDLRRKLYVKAKAEPHWRFWGLRHLKRSRNRRGVGWERWSTQVLHATLGLFNGYRVRPDLREAYSARPVS
jgi:hypothetical protein